MNPTPSPAPQWAKDAAIEIDKEADFGGTITPQNAVGQIAAIITKHAAAISEENAKLRFFLYVNYTGCRGYHDDGELQDATALPFIDFKRDSVSEIERKMAERSAAWFKANPDVIKSVLAAHPAQGMEGRG